MSIIPFELNSTIIPEDDERNIGEFMNELRTTPLVCEVSDYGYSHEPDFLKKTLAKELHLEDSSSVNVLELNTASPSDFLESMRSSLTPRVRLFLLTRDMKDRIRQNPSGKPGHSLFPLRMIEYEAYEETSNKFLFVNSHTGSVVTDSHLVSELISTADSSKEILEHHIATVSEK